MVKIVSWNVNSIRKGIVKTLEELIKEHNPDIICFQETRGIEKDIIPYFTQINEYKYRYYNDSIKGHAGVSTWSRIEPINVVYDIGDMTELAKGRVIYTEFEDFSVLNTYVPNTGIYEDRRHFWHKCIVKFLDSIDTNNLIWCGDLNVVDEPSLDTSHYEERPESGIAPAGLKKYEKEQFDMYKIYGLIDVFRHMCPDKKSFTWYSPRRRDVGWRLDYFMVGNVIADNTKLIIHGPRLESTISDHTWVIFEN